MDHAEKQMTLDKRYMRMATIWAENSYCQRRQVGALIVKDKMIISDGYNGTPAGFENRCEDETGHTYPYVLHAEANAITKVACSNNSSEGATLYVTSSPCIECAKLIIQSGIKRGVLGILPPARRNRIASESRHIGRLCSGTGKINDITNITSPVKDVIHEK